MQTISLKGLAKNVHVVTKKTELIGIPEGTEILHKLTDGRTQIVTLIKVDNEPYQINGVWVKGKYIENLLKNAETFDLEDVPFDDMEE